jgi:hypothetical protein
LKKDNGDSGKRVLNLVQTFNCVTSEDNICVLMGTSFMFNVTGIILKGIERKQGGRVWTGFMWLRIRAGGVLLYLRFP